MSLILNYIQENPKETQRLIGLESELLQQLIQKEIVGVYIGECSQFKAEKLCSSLRAVCYTDFWEAYACILLSIRHKRIGKDSGLTNHIERFNNTLRQRVSRDCKKDSFVL